MSKKLFIALLLPFAILGCKGNPVVGTWTASGAAASGAGSLTFKGDKTFEASLPGATTPMLTGTYEVKDKEVDMTMAQMAGQPIPKADQQVVPGTLSDDGKQMTFQGATFIKQ